MNKWEGKRKNSAAWITCFVKVLKRHQVCQYSSHTQHILHFKLSLECLNCDHDHVTHTFLPLISRLVAYQFKWTQCNPDTRGCRDSTPSALTRGLCSCGTIWDLTRNAAMENQPSSSVLSWAMSGGIVCSNVPLVLPHLKWEVITECAHQEELMNREVQFLVIFRTNQIWETLKFLSIIHEHNIYYKETHYCSHALVQQGWVRSHRASSVFKISATSLITSIDRNFFPRQTFSDCANVFVFFWPFACN